jgi:hypothetical protein
MAWGTNEDLDALTCIGMHDIHRLVVARSKRIGQPSLLNPEEILVVL